MNANWEAFQNLAKFEALAGQIDQGIAPYDINGANAISDAVNFYGNWANLGQAVNDFQYTRRYSAMGRTADDIGMFDYFNVYQKNGRHCVMVNERGDVGGSHATYETNLITSLNMAVAVHEFGHSLGLEHNFIGSVDQRNFPLDSLGNPTLYSSSIMDYNQAISEAFYETSIGSGTTPAPGSGTYNNPKLAANGVWGPYDVGATRRGSTQATPRPRTPARSAVPTGMTSTTRVRSPGQRHGPVERPQLGFVSGAAETPFLFLRTTTTCEVHAALPPVRPRLDSLGDHGERPPAARVELPLDELPPLPTSTSARRATGAAWRRSSTRCAASSRCGRSTGRRASSATTCASSASRRRPATRRVTTSTQLTDKFNTDISVANQLMATYHRAIIEQSSGERPYVTTFDPYYGDVTQQGIQIDKVTATNSFSSALSERFANYDPSQSAGIYLTAFGGQEGDAAYFNVSQDVLSDYLGASYATYQYSQVGPLAAFANATHSPAYSGDLQLQTWVGGYAFNRERDFLDFVHAIAVKYDFPNCDENGNNCHQCTWAISARSRLHLRSALPAVEVVAAHPVEPLQHLPGPRRPDLHLGLHHQPQPVDPRRPGSEQRHVRPHAELDDGRGEQRGRPWP